jgi:hypothetical protein
MKMRWIKSNIATRCFHYDNLPFIIIYGGKKKYTCLFNLHSILFVIYTLVNYYKQMFIVLGVSIFFAQSPYAI